MIFPTVYVIEDSGDNITRLEKLFEHDGLARNLEYFIQEERIEEEQAAILRKVPPPWPLPKIMNVRNINTDLPNILRVLGENQGEPAVLLLDYKLQPGVENSVHDKTAEAILSAYKPSKGRRLWVNASAFAEAGSSNIVDKYSDSKVPKNAGLNQASCAGYFLGVLRWLQLNRDLFARFLDELLNVRNHNGTINDNNWVNEYAPIFADIVHNYADASVHNLASSRRVGLDMAYLIALISFRGAINDGEKEKLFAASTLNQYYTSKEKRTIFLGEQTFDDRKLTLKIFNEVFKRLYVCDLNVPCAGCTQGSTLKGVFLDRRSLQLDFCFPPKQLPFYIQAAIHNSAAICVKEIEESGTEVGTCSDVGTPHYTSRLLYALRLALCLADPVKIEAGNNYFGSDVILEVSRKGMNDNDGIKVIFHA